MTDFRGLDADVDAEAARVAADVEAAYLCALMWATPSIALAAAEHVTVGDFYQPAAAALFDVISGLLRSDRPADPTMVLAEVRRHGDTVTARHLTMITRYLTETTAMPRGSHVEPLRAAAYGCEVTAMAYRRAFAVAAEQIAECAYTFGEDELWEAMCRCGRRIREMRSRLTLARRAAATASDVDACTQVDHVRSLTRQNNDVCSPPSDRSRSAR